VQAALVPARLLPAGYCRPSGRGCPGLGHGARVEPSGVPWPSCISPYQERSISPHDHVHHVMYRCESLTAGWVIHSASLANKGGVRRSAGRGIRAARGRSALNLARDP